MRILVTYDIATSDQAGQRRLRKVARAMEGFGVRVQRSVFECDLDAAQIVRLELVARELIDPTRDSVLVYRLMPDRTLRLGTSGPDPVHDRRHRLARLAERRKKAQKGLKQVPVPFGSRRVQRRKAEESPKGIETPSTDTRRGTPRPPQRRRREPSKRGYGSSGASLGLTKLPV